MHMRFNTVIKVTSMHMILIPNTTEAASFAVVAVIVISMGTHKEHNEEKA